MADSTFYAKYGGLGGGGSGGVTSLNTLTGALTLVGAGGITITPSGGNTLTITGTSGTVTSVGLADSTGLFNIAGSPVMTAGTLTLASLKSQAQNLVFAGPSSGGAGAPSFRALIAGDIPTLAYISTTLGATALSGGLTVSGNTLSAAQATTSTSGWLSSTDWNTFNGKQAAGSYVLTSAVGAANGVASLDSSGKVPLAQLPASVFIYQGMWNPNTNTPTLVDGTGTTGFTYWVSAARLTAVSGLTNASMVNFQIGDLVLYNGSQYELTTPAAGVQSVNGSTGAVTVNAINQLTGDGTAGPASGSASAAFTLASVNSNVGTFGSLSVIPSVTVNAKGLTTAVSSISSTAIPTASSFAGWDANSNLSANNLIEGYSTTATSASTRTLTVTSTYQQYFTGTTAGQILQLPVSSTLVLGFGFLVTNNSTQTVTVNSSGGNLVLAQPAGTTVTYTCILTSGTTAASWFAQVIGAGGAITPTVSTALNTGTATGTGGFVSGTYTTPANVAWIEVEMVGAGGGGAQSGPTSAQSGSAGGNTTFGTSLLTANGGAGASNGNSNGGTGGTASVTASSTVIQVAVLQGGFGGASSQNSTASASYPAGGIGGTNPFGGAGSGGAPTTFGSNGIPNTGGGGGGGGGSNSATTNSGAGGGAGGYVKAIIYPTAGQTFSYNVGAVGAGGNTGSNAAGGQGGLGGIRITEYYNNGAIGTATNVTGIVAVANGGTGANFFPISAWVSWTPTITGFGTVSGVVAYSRRVGDSLQCRVKFTSGTSTAVLGQCSIGYNGIDSNETTSANMGNPEVGGIALGSGANQTFNVLLYPSSQVVQFSSSGAPLTAANGNALLVSGNVMSFNFTIPISGWTVNTGS